jgi:hypothetical protein
VQRIRLEQLPWIAAPQSHRVNPLDELRLRTCVGFSRLGSRRRELSGEATFEVFVLTSHVRMVAQVVAKGQCPPFFGPPSFNDMKVMTVWPLGRPMEERAKRVVWMRNVDVSNRVEAFAVGGEWLKYGH